MKNRYGFGLVPDKTMALALLLRPFVRDEDADLPWDQFYAVVKDRLEKELQKD